jgi:hypothetical protein
MCANYEAQHYIVVFFTLLLLLPFDFQIFSLAPSSQAHSSYFLDVRIQSHTKLK